MHDSIVVRDTEYCRTVHSNLVPDHIKIIKIGLFYALKSRTYLLDHLILLWEIRKISITTTVGRSAISEHLIDECGKSSQKNPISEKS